MMVTISTAAEILGVDVSTLRRWDSSGTLAAQRSAGGHRQYSEAALLAFAQANNLRPHVPLQKQIDVLTERLGIVEEMLKANQ